MISNTSINNLEIIKNFTKHNNAECVFLVDYAHHVKSFLDFFIDQSFSEDKTDFFCFTEKLPDFVPSGKNIVFEKSWSLKDYRNFFLGKPGEKFEKHQSVYSGDIARLPMWRKLYAMGPLSSFSRKLRSFVPPKICDKLIDPILMIIGLIAQIAVPSMRMKAGKANFSYRGKAVTIYYDGSPEKDHYGESPAVAKKIELFEKIVIRHAGRACSGFFIAAGPRHIYMEKIFNLEDSEKIKKYFIFARGLFRPKAFQITNRRPAGCFYQGNNISAEDKPVYSSHCLSIGAGEKEIWYYSSRHDSNPHEKK